jgi:hypothetical protein
MPNINRIRLPDGNIYDLVKKEVTQAEYVALSEDEKNKGTMYCITDSSSPVDLEVFDQRTSNYGKFYFTEINGIKVVRIVDPKNLTAKAYTTLDFTLPTNFRPQMDVHETLFVPSADNVAIRFNIITDGTVLIYNYSTATGTLNIANTMTYV